MLLHLGRKHEPTHLDKEVKDWITEHRVAWLDLVADVGGWLGTLPLTAAAAALTVVALRRRAEPGATAWPSSWFWRRARRWGWLLILLLRRETQNRCEPRFWPFGFAGLVPLRGMAVFGMSAYQLTRQEEKYRGAMHAAVAVIIFLTGFSVLWTGTQTVTELLLEYATGSIVLFVAIRRLEGYRRGWPHAADRGNLVEPPTLLADLENHLVRARRR